MPHPQNKKVRIRTRWRRKGISNRCSRFEIARQRRTYCRVRISSNRCELMQIISPTNESSWIGSRRWTHPRRSRRIIKMLGSLAQGRITKVNLPLVAWQMLNRARKNRARNSHRSIWVVLSKACSGRIPRRRIRWMRKGHSASRGIWKSTSMITNLPRRGSRRPVAIGLRRTPRGLRSMLKHKRHRRQPSANFSCRRRKYRLSYRNWIWHLSMVLTAASRCRKVNETRTIKARLSHLRQVRSYDCRRRPRARVNQLAASSVTFSITWAESSQQLEQMRRRWSRSAPLEAPRSRRKRRRLYPIIHRWLSLDSCRNRWPWQAVKRSPQRKYQKKT